MYTKLKHKDEVEGLRLARSRDPTPTGQTIKLLRAAASARQHLISLGNECSPAAMCATSNDASCIRSGVPMPTKLFCELAGRAH